MEGWRDGGRKGGMEGGRRKGVRGTEGGRKGEGGGRKGGREGRKGEQASEVIIKKTAVYLPITIIVMGRADSITVHSAQATVWECVVCVGHSLH